MDVAGDRDYSSDEGPFTAFATSGPQNLGMRIFRPGRLVQPWWVGVPESRNVVPDH